jgi:hypothetical protein
MFLLLSAALLGACATPTPYRPATDGTGYSEQQLEPDRYRVTFAGNSRTPRGRVANGLLLRAAELTRETGHDHFIVVSRDTERSVTYHTTVTDLGPPGVVSHRRFFGIGHDPFGFDGFATVTARPRDSYRAVANIVLRQGPKPADDPHAYDARAVIERLRPALAADTAD